MSITLAATQSTDTLVISGVALQMLCNVIVIGWQIWLNTKVRHFENLKSEVKQQTRELAYAELKNLRTELMAEIKVISNQMAQTSKRLQRGDDLFDMIAQRDNQMEIRWINKLDEIKKYISENFASGDHVNRIEDRVTNLQSTIDRIKGGQA